MNLFTFSKPVPFLFQLFQFCIPLIPFRQFSYQKTKGRERTQEKPKRKPPDSHWMTELKQASEFDIADIKEFYPLTPGEPSVTIWLVDFDEAVLEQLNVAKRVLENYKFESGLGGLFIQCNSFANKRQKII